jgi:hypothetical protein
MSVPDWAGVDSNLGSVLLSDFFVRYLTAVNAVSYALVGGQYPNIQLTAAGMLQGSGTVLNPIPNTPIFIHRFTVRATSESGETADKEFSLSIIYFSSYVPPDPRQNRVRFFNNQFEYIINRGDFIADNNVYWRLGGGELPPNVTIYPNGSIVGNAIKNNPEAKPLSREEFLRPNIPSSGTLSQGAWNAWATEILTAPVDGGEFDYQFVLNFSAADGPILLSVTARLIYKQVSLEDKWFKTNRINLQFNPATYYIFFTVSDHNYIDWITPAQLPNIINGAVSELSLSATTNDHSKLYYSIKPGITNVIPQGIALSSNGLLLGRTSFRCFQDDPATVPINDYYEFTVRAVTDNYFTYSEKIFNWRVIRVHDKPYTNIWIRSFPKVEERLNLSTTLGDPRLFPPKLIYRTSDEWFGKGRDLRFLFAPGVKYTDMANYTAMLEQNHYKKSLLIGDVKTAIAHDEQLNIVYEVVYLPILDQGSRFDRNTSTDISLPDIIDLRPYIKNFYQKNGTINYTIESNSLVNMRNRIKSTVGYYNSGILPRWMTSPQPIPDKPGQFFSPLGLISGIVLAYTIPGGSSQIAFKLKQSGVNFNNFKFEFDRYELDQNLSGTFSNASNGYAISEPTTFDDDFTTFEHGTTKFGDNLDYSIGSRISEIGNKYLKFPKTGAFN